MRNREVWPMVWAGLGLSLAAEVVYVTDLTIFTHLAPCAASAVSNAVMAMTTSVCPPGATDLQACVCSTSYNHKIVETRISNSVYGCNSTATGEQASARTVYDTYCGRRADRDEDESNAGAIAGAVVGVVLGLAAAAAGTLFYMRRRRIAKGQTQDGAHPRLTDDEDDDTHPVVYGTAAAIASTVSSTSSISKSAEPARIENASPVLDRASSRPTTGSIRKQSSGPPPTKPLPPPQRPAQWEQADHHALTVEDVDPSLSQHCRSADEEQSVQQSHQTSTRSGVIGQQSYQTSTQSDVTEQQVHSGPSRQRTTTHAHGTEFRFDLGDHGFSTPNASPPAQLQEAFHSGQASHPSSPTVTLSSSPPTRQFLPRLEMQGHQPLMDWSESSYYSTTSQQVSQSGLSSEHSSYTVTNAQSPPSAGEHRSHSVSTQQQSANWRSGSIDGFREMD